MALFYLNIVVLLSIFVSSSWTTGHTTTLQIQILKITGTRNKELQGVNTKFKEELNKLNVYLYKLSETRNALSNNCDETFGNVTIWKKHTRITMNPQLVYLNVIILIENWTSNGKCMTMLKNMRSISLTDLAKLLNSIA